MNKIIHSFPFAIVLALLACTYLSGCAGKPKRPPSVQPGPGIATGDILDAISLQANQLISLKARVKLKLTIHDKAQPEIKGRLMWTRTHQGELARVTGHGPFGVTVFDCLVAKKAFYLFIPSHNAVYVTDINDKLRNGKEISSLINEASWLLNPWSVVETQNVEVAPCKEERNFKNYGNPVCISFSNQGGPRWAKFDRQTLSPISLENPELKIFYDDPVLLEDCAPYPSKIRMKLKELDLEIKITLKDIQPGSLTPEDPVFDPTPYFSQPLRPLMLLLDPLRYQTY
ncbi:MAG: hypothetical protein U9Q89_08040 [Thermodesulfobacteriota bacterium]|nr:hypothetical protein [Thermodesulfobacteriota bacterium]